MEPRRLCHRTRNRAFTDPEGSTDLAIRAALRMCEACPALRECAVEALAAGSIPEENVVAPAASVIQAGVWCDGGSDVPTQLAAVAGVEPPTYGRKVRRRKWAGEACRACGRRMSRWSRGGPAEGTVMHRGRGICTECRRFYTEELEATGPLRVTRERRSRLDRLIAERTEARLAAANRRGAMTAN